MLIYVLFYAYQTWSVAQFIYSPKYNMLEEAFDESPRGGSGIADMNVVQWFVTFLKMKNLLEHTAVWYKKLCKKMVKVYGPNMKHEQD